MEKYHKINSIFKRYTDGPKKGKLILGEYSTPELEYLKDNEWEFTEKVDGTNIRINLVLVDGDMYVIHGGRTDQAVIPMPLLEHLEKVFPTFHTHRRDLSAPAYIDRYNHIISWMVEAGVQDVILYGEGYGPKIQGGGKYRSDHSFVLFDVKIGDWWLNRKDVNDIAEKLNISSVPVIGHGTLQDAIDIVSTGLTWDKNGKMTNWGGVETIAGKPSRTFAGLKSTWGDFEAEGIIARPVIPLFTSHGERVIVKVKGRDFK